jgi:hypothetical protein
MRETMKQRLDPETSGWQMAAGKLGVLWCAFMHESSTWPIHGEYRCRTCGRHYPVPWAGNKRSPALFTRTAAAPAPIRHGHVPSFRSALLPLFFALTALLVSTARAADAPIVEANAPASMAFARYAASLEQASPWILESVEIDASLPKFEKRGRLRAIRRLVPFGKPEYQVIEIAGDQTVRQQVIIRYLSAEVRAAAIPASSVAITPENYKFRYKGPVKTGAAVAYVFLITPRKKRDGLIKGELWLDGETGVVVRQSGYLVKKPSIFVKRVDIARETTLRDGIAEMRVTHLSVDTRLVGRAELTIQEHPCTGPDQGPGLSIAEGGCGSGLGSIMSSPLGYGRASEAKGVGAW